MSYKFSKEDKAETEFKERIPYGVSTVKLVGATAGETDAGKPYIELTIVNDAGVEDNARVWFVGGASVYSFGTLRQIIVHQAKTDSDKEKARQAVENAVDNEALVELINKKCIGGELWFTKYIDPKNSYLAADGKTRQSVNRNIYGYEPKLKPELMPKSVLTDDAVEVTDAAMADPGANIPSDWE